MVSHSTSSLILITQYSNFFHCGCAVLCFAVGDDSDDEGKGKGKEVEVEGDGLQDVDNSEAEIAKLLGFGGFSSTKVRSIYAPGRSDEIIILMSIL